jgi:hypothetical protein
VDYVWEDPTGHFQHVLVTARTRTHTSCWYWMCQSVWCWDIDC